MMRFINHLIWFVGVIALQVFVLDNIHFLGVFLPLIYVYALLRWPSDLSPNLTLILGFILGLSIDVLSNTPGMHAFATTLMAALRYPVLRLFVSKEDLGSKVVSEKSLGTAVFWRYTVILVIVHHTALFLLEYFSFVNWVLLLVKIPVCSLLTLLFVYVLERINSTENAKY
ncbi:MAG: rod shape-determining protein MreD [Bacteroidales bacterium]|nr:rod shape-determining protein MreD [Bacteroidales bacterium]